MVAINRSIHFSCKEQHIQATIGTKVPETIDTKMPDAFLIPINDTPGKRVFVSKNVPQHSSNGIVAVSKLEHIFHRLPRGEHAMIARTTSGFAIADSRKPTVSEETVAYKARPTACQQVTRREQCSHRGRIYWFTRENQIYLGQAPLVTYPVHMYWIRSHETPAWHIVTSSWTMPRSLRGPIEDRMATSLRQDFR